MNFRCWRYKSCRTQYTLNAYTGTIALDDGACPGARSMIARISLSVISYSAANSPSAVLTGAARPASLRPSTRRLYLLQRELDCASAQLAGTASPATPQIESPLRL